MTAPPAVARRAGRGRQPVPGAILLRPTVLASLVVLLLNDHRWKAQHGNAATGKLSDVAGLYLFPLLLLALGELTRWLRADAAGRAEPASWAYRRPEVVGAVAATAVGFAAIKLSPAAGTAYAEAIGAARWLVEAIPSLLVGAGLPESPHVQHIRDPTDLAALPSVLLAHRLATRRATAGHRRGLGVTRFLRG